MKREVATAVACSVIAEVMNVAVLVTGVVAM